MGMQLNIKNEDAYRMASRLSELTGESLTTAVTTALRERLEREEQTRHLEERTRDREEWKRRIRAIAADIRAHMKHPLPTSDHGWLYDEETGLPK